MSIRALSSTGIAALVFCLSEQLAELRLWLANDTLHSAILRRHCPSLTRTRMIPVPPRARVRLDRIMEYRIECSHTWTYTTSAWLGYGATGGRAGGTDARPTNCTPECTVTFRAAILCPSFFALLVCIPVVSAAVTKSHPDRARRVGYQDGQHQNPSQSCPSIRAQKGSSKATSIRLWPDSPPGSRRILGLNARRSEKPIYSRHGSTRLHNPVTVLRLVPGNRPVNWENLMKSLACWYHSTQVP